MPLNLVNTADDFVSAVRRDAFTANSDDNWPPANILGIADDCLTGPIASALKREKQGYFQKDYDVQLVAGQAYYDVPQDAMWNGTELIQLIDKTTGLIGSQLSDATSSTRWMYGFGVGGTPVAYYMDDTQIVLCGTPQATDVAAYSMTVSTYRRPGKLVVLANAARVVSVNSITQVVTTSTQPTSWATDAVDVYTSGSPYRIDFYGRNSPNTLRVSNATMTTGGAGTTLTFAPFIAAASFAKIQPGDVVNITGQTCFPDLPVNCVPYLRKMTQQTLLTAQTDPQGLQAYLATMATEMALFIKGTANRKDGTPRKLSLFNAAAMSFMRRGYRRE